MINQPQGQQDSVARSETKKLKVEVEELRKELKTWKNRAVIIGAVGFILARILALVGF